MSTNENIGYTIQVPFKVFGNPAVFWNLIRRNILIGIAPKRLKFDQEAAHEVCKQLVNTINTFTSKARFNAEGLQNDGQEPIEQVYEEWTKSLDFFITLHETENGALRFDLGIKEVNPWRGLMLEKVSEFFAAFYLNKEDKVVLRPSIDKVTKVEELEDYHSTVGVVPYYTWNHGVAIVPGSLPSMCTLSDIVTKVEELGAKLTKEFGNISNEYDIEAFQQTVEEQLDTFAAWGNGPMAAEASVFGRLVPMVNDKPVLFVGINIRGDFTLNFFHRVNL